MKREMAVVREILEFAEGLDEANPKTFSSSRRGEEWTATQAEYHVDLCVQAGLVTPRQPPRGRLLTGLTWAGHDLLDKFIHQADDLKECHGYEGP